MTGARSVLVLLAALAAVTAYVVPATSTPALQHRQLASPLRAAGDDQQPAPAKKPLLSQLKRQRKPKETAKPGEPEGELRPLIRKPLDRESVLRGEDYWIDINAVQEDKPLKPLLKKDQFKQDKLKDEIVSPYTKNYVLGITLGIALLVALVQMNPGVLDTYPIINFPEEL